MTVTDYCCTVLALIDAPVLLKNPIPVFDSEGNRTDKELDLISYKSRGPLFPSREPELENADDYRVKKERFSSLAFEDEQLPIVRELTEKLAGKLYDEYEKCSRKGSSPDERWMYRVTHLLEALKEPIESDSLEDSKTKQPKTPQKYSLIRTVLDLL